MSHSAWKCGWPECNGRHTQLMNICNAFVKSRWCLFKCWLEKENASFNHVQSTFYITVSAIILSLLHHLILLARKSARRLKKRMAAKKTRLPTSGAFQAAMLDCRRVGKCIQLNINERVLTSFGRTSNKASWDLKDHETTLKTCTQKQTHSQTHTQTHSASMYLYHFIDIYTWVFEVQLLVSSLTHFSPKKGTTPFHFWVSQHWRSFGFQVLPQMSGWIPWI